MLRLVISSIVDLTITMLMLIWRGVRALRRLLLHTLVPR
jgi:hypothetical protein